MTLWCHLQGQLIIHLQFLGTKNQQKKVIPFQIYQSFHILSPTNCSNFICAVNQHFNSVIQLYTDVNQVTNDLIDFVVGAIKKFPHYSIIIPTNQSSWVDCTFLTLRKLTTTTSRHIKQIVLCTGHWLKNLEINVIIM